MITHYKRRRSNFVNASSNITENLKFLLRAASANQPFSYVSNMKTDGTTNYIIQESRIAQPEDWFARAPSPTDYEYYGYHYYSPNLGHSIMREVRPVQENFLWRNFAYQDDNFIGGYLISGAGCDVDNFFGPTILMRTLWAPPLHQYTGSGSESTIPLAGTDSTWTYYSAGEFMWPDGYQFPPSDGLGMHLNNDGSATISNALKSCYGLGLNSLTFGDTTFAPGSTISEYELGSYAFINFAEPILSTEGYYFVSQTPYFRDGAPL